MDIFCVKYLVFKNTFVRHGNPGLLPAPVRVSDKECDSTVYQ